MSDNEAAALFRQRARVGATGIDAYREGGGPHSAVIRQEVSLANLRHDFDRFLHKRLFGQLFRDILREHACDKD